MRQPAEAVSADRLRRAAPFLTPVVAGVVAAAGQPPLALPPLALAGVAGLMALGLAAPGPRRAFRVGWLAGLGYFGAALHWIVEPFLVDVARHGWMAPFALVLLAGGLALFWGAAFWAAGRLAGPRAGLWPRALALAATLTAAEFARATVLGGFPWAMIGSLWTGAPPMMLAAWVGPHGLTLLTLVALVPAAVALAGGPRAPLAATAAALVLATGLGMALAARIPADPAPDRPVVRLIQPNAPQHLKWRADMIPVFWARKLAFTAAPAARPPDAVIWPEVALPYLLGADPDATAAIADAAAGAPVIAGAQRFDGPALHNSLAVIAPGGRVAEIYDKHHLVPFGEYVPGGALAAWAGLTGLATDALGGFSPGPGRRLLDLSAYGLGRVLPLICYEAIFPRHAAPIAGARPDWIVHVTNDAWFGTFAGPQQHLAQARARAVEQGLPVVRAANTGISAVIDPAGRLRATIPLGEAGFRDVILPPPAPTTPYARTGDVPTIAALAAALAGLVLVTRRRRRAGGV